MKELEKCTRGDCATFGWNVPSGTTATVDAGNPIPYNQIISDGSEKCCKSSIRLNTGTGEIFIDDGGWYQFAVDVEVTPVINTSVTIFVGNGGTALIPLYTGTSRVVTLPVKHDSVVKVVSSGTVLLSVTQGTNSSMPLSTIEVVKLKGF